MGELRKCIGSHMMRGGDRWEKVQSELQKNIPFYYKLLEGGPWYMKKWFPFQESFPLSNWSLCFIIKYVPEEREEIIQGVVFQKVFCLSSPESRRRYMVSNY